MRFLHLLPPILALAACSEDDSRPGPGETPPPEISYSTEVRPLLIENCLGCHADLPLHNPTEWNLLHQHLDVELKTPDLLQEWADQGSKIDPHWAGSPLRKISALSIDDCIESDVEAPPVAREAPAPIFTSLVEDLLAGDHMEDRDRAFSTGYLRRQKNESPEWRIEKVASEFLGVRIACARCHDHPSEHWDTTRYARFKKLFSTPFDDLEGSIRPLRIFKSEEQELKITELETALEKACEIPAPREEDYLNWMALDQGLPTLPGLVAAYSFDDHQLINLAPSGGVRADGSNLLAENGAHGQGLLFEGNNELVITGLPFGSELDHFTISTWIKVDPETIGDTSIATIGTRSKGFDFRVIAGKLQARWIQSWPDFSAVSTSKIPLIVPGRWNHVAVTYDGSRRAEGMAIYLNGRAIDTEKASTRLFKPLPRAEALTINARGLWLDELQLFHESLTPLGIRQLFDGTSLVTKFQNGGDLRHYYQRHFDPGEKSRREQVRVLNEELIKIENELTPYLVMAENPDWEPIPESNEPANRLEFAQRLNKDLLARSLANKVWEQHFGTPLAHSLGFSDLLPTHPDLLEFLAGNLRDSEFDVARLGLLIRASRAWQKEWPRLEREPASCPR